MYRGIFAITHSIVHSYRNVPPFIITIIIAKNELSTISILCLPRSDISLYTVFIVAYVLLQQIVQHRLPIIPVILIPSNICLRLALFVTNTNSDASYPLWNSKGNYA